jgi:FtsP/CotA-like multicopper oxidase with cupredoxin domain
MRKKTLSSAVSMALAVGAGLGSQQTAQANVGYGWATMSDGTEQAIETFFANSPSGTRQLLDPNLKAHVETLLPGLYPAADDTRLTSSGKALRKFVDPLPLPGVVSTMADGTSRTMAVATPEKWKAPQAGMPGDGVDDYYEIAVVEYKTKMHSDLAHSTTLRGYVQLVTNTMSDAIKAAAVQLTYPDGTAIQIQDTNADGTLKFDNTGAPVMKPALAVQKPDYLGPAIIATKGVPVRYKFYNLLPVGSANVDGPAPTDGTLYEKVNVTARNGDLFIPVDPSLMGAGFGPDGMTMYGQNRATIHLHGGDTPWISDGTPHQWIAPAGESVKNPADTIVTMADQVVDETYLPSYLRGASAVNVPDMPDPGPGAMTFYFPNEQSARLMFYHDHSAGITRLNVYAGEAAPYILTDDVDAALTNGGTVTRNGVDTNIAKALPTRWMPLVLQDKTFVPEDIALQDARWNTTAWGKPGDLWFPHVYETVQDPAQLNNWNAVGRWHYGPYFWPVFPALYELPTGQYNDVTTTPEAWQDTAVVNGVAYPTVTVDPTSYRLRILNAANDRMMTFNMFVADSAQSFTDPVTGETRLTEVKMQPAMVPNATNGLTACAAGVLRPQPITDGTGAVTGYCTPETWPTDNRAGGVPSADSAGPTLYQIASEGGLLPKVAPIEPTPINFQYDKGRITVLNVLTDALYLGPAERADVVVDFSQYAGKTLIVYNDAPAPVPAGDPRNDYFTEVGDQSPEGGAEDTLRGYGPNTRTFMQIKVRATAEYLAQDGDFSMDAAHIATLEAELPKAYALSQERPVVGQSVYNSAFGETWTDNVSSNVSGGAYSSIYVGSLKEPAFKFQPGAPGLWNSVVVTNPGSGYTSAPDVVFDASTTCAAGAGCPGTGASATATLKISNITVTNPGTGYTVPPAVSIVAQRGGGTGATATASLAAVGATITNGGSGYSNAAPPTVLVSAPQDGEIGIQAVGVPLIDDVTNKVTGISFDPALGGNPGRGYDRLPTVTIGLPYAGALSTTRARATLVAGVGHVKLVAPDPLNPISYNADGTVLNLGSAGGGGYTDMTVVAGVPGVAVTFKGNGTGAAALPTGSVFDVTMVSFGTGYVSLPNISLNNGGGVGATAFVDMDATVNPDGRPMGSALVKTKAVHELFDATYGRLNSIGAVEIPFTSALTQTTIPLAYIDPATEGFEDGETQIWKFTHNGVDTHPVHFHLLNVQVINRVGWDGFISPPAANELGWKETVKMNPLEDVIVAVRAKKPKLPGFGLPNSQRLLDPTQPEGSPFGFTQVDAATGNPAVVTNKPDDFKWEYVWHCHILGHEENDFMRPVKFDAKEAAAVAPTLDPLANATTGAVSTPAGVELTWVDNASSEFRFDIQRAPVVGGVAGGFATVGQAVANIGTYTDATAAEGTNYAYKVVAVAQNGNGVSGEVQLMTNVYTLPAAPTGLSATVNGPTSVGLTWTDNATNEATYQVFRSVDGGTNWTNIEAALPADSVSYTDVSALPNVTYAYKVAAVNGAGVTDSNVVPDVVTPLAPVSALSATPTTSDVTLSWNNANQGAYTVSVLRNGVDVTADGVFTASGFVDNTVTPATAYTYTVTVSAAGQTDAVSTVSTATGAIAATGLTVGAVSASSVTLSWTLPVGGGLSNVEVLRAGVSVFSDATGSATAWTDTTVASNTAYNYVVRVTAAAGGTPADSSPASATTAPAAVNGLAATATASSVALSWSNANPGVSTVTVTRNDGAAIAVVGNTATDAAVAANTAYTYTVTVTGANGTADATASATTLPVSAVIGAPVTTSNSVTLNWTNSNPNVTTVNVLRNGVAVASGLSGVNSFTDVGLVPNSSYTYTVEVVGAAGTATDTATGITAPAALVAGAISRTSYSVTLNWSIPVQGPLTNITVTRNDGVTTTLAGSATSFVDNAAMPSMDYTYTLVATGLNGTATTVMGPVHTPAQLALPTAYTGRLADATMVELRWTDTSVGETGFRIQMRTNGGAYATVNPASMTALTYGAGGAMSALVTIPGAQAQYDFTVAALDGATVGAVTARQRVDLSVVPPRPASLLTAAAAGGVFNLQWADAANNNARYELQVRSRPVGGVYTAWSNADLAIGANATAYTYNGATAGRQYQFQIRAVNVRGASQWRTGTAVTAQ